MVKGRGKGKKQYSATASEDGDEKMPVRRRGRPLKLLKEDDIYAYAEEVEEEEEEEEEEFEEEEFEKIGKEDGVEERISAKNSVLKTRAAVGTKKKRKKKRALNIAKKSLDLVVKEDQEDIEEDKADVMKTVGLKQIGSSRRKSKPHRAAEVGVECL